jgi:hypothetical protein
LDSQPSSRTGENSPYGMIGGIEETSASFEARSAPRSYPTATRSLASSIWRFSEPFRCIGPVLDSRVTRSRGPQHHNLGIKFLKRNVPSNLSGRRSAYSSKWWYRLFTNGGRIWQASPTLLGVVFKIFVPTSLRSRGTSTPTGSPYKRFQYTAGPDVAVSWARQLGARKIVPYATFTFKKPSVPVRKFADEIARAGLADRLVALRPLDAMAGTRL